MKRDLDLVRSILIYVENADSEVDGGSMATERWPIEPVAYLVRLMACPPPCAGMIPEKRIWSLQRLRAVHKNQP